MTPEEPIPAGGGTVPPTSPRTLVIAAVVGAGIGWLTFAGLDALGQALPGVPLAAALAIAVCALVVAGMAVSTHRVIQTRKQRVEPRRAVALLALGKTALVAGSGLAAGYLAVAIFFWPRIDASLPRDRVWASLLAAAAAIGLAISGFFLERACRVPRPPDDEDDTFGAPPGNTGSD